MRYLSKTNASIVFTNTISKLSVDHTATLNEAWTAMGEFQRIRDPDGSRHTVALKFFDDAEQVVGELLDIIVQHQDDDAPVLRITVGSTYTLEFVNPVITSIVSPGFGACSENLTLIVTVAYDCVKRTTITK